MRSARRGTSLASGHLRVVAGVGGELAVVVHPLELQGPAPLRKAGENQAVPFQVNLWQTGLRFKVRHDVI